MKKTLAVSLAISTLPLKSMAGDWNVPKPNLIKVTATTPEALWQASTVAQNYSALKNIDYIQISFQPKMNSATVYFKENPETTLDGLMAELKAILGDSVKVEKVTPSAISAGTQDDQVSNPK
jgi:hypothetical protein